MALLDRDEACVSILDKLAGLFRQGPLGSLQTGQPRLIRIPFGQALFGGALALVVVCAVLAAVWIFGERGHWLERALLSWLLAWYLHTAFTVHPRPEADFGVAGGLLDAPNRWNDEGNTALVAMLVILLPGKWLVTRTASLLLWSRLPSSEQLADRLVSESGSIDYELQSDPPAVIKAQQTPDDFHRALRRPLPSAWGLACVVAAGVWFAWLRFVIDVPPLNALAAFLLVEGMARVMQAAADSGTAAHPDLLHMWVSQRRPDLLAQGQQVVRIRVVLLGIWLRFLLAIGLVMFVSHGG